MRSLFATLTTLLLLNAGAAACPGQAGKVIFEDSFADDSGGWQLGAPDTEIKDGALWLRPNPRGMSKKDAISVRRCGRSPQPTAIIAWNSSSQSRWRRTTTS